MWLAAKDNLIDKRNLIMAYSIDVIILRKYTIYNAIEIKRLL